jgi:hypothetical protein
MEQQSEQWREYLDHKNKMRKLRFGLSGQYGSNLMNKKGFHLDWYDVRERIKFGGNKIAHKIIEDEFSHRESE